MFLWWNMSSTKNVFEISFFYAPNQNAKQLIIGILSSSHLLRLEEASD